MRMRQTRVQTYHLANRKVDKDGEGVPVISYGTPLPFSGEIWPATSKLQVQTYGDRISGIFNCKIEGPYKIVHGNPLKYEFDNFALQEGDGVYIFAGIDTEPDYKIISIKPYNPLRLEVERL